MEPDRLFESPPVACCGGRCGGTKPPFLITWLQDAQPGSKILLDGAVWEFTSHDGTTLRLRALIDGALPQAFDTQELLQYDRVAPYYEEPVES